MPQKKKSDKKEVQVETTADPKVLSKLSRSHDQKVRMFVAENVLTPPKVLARMSKDKNLNIRDAVASNPKTPIDILQKLVNQKNMFLSEKAVETLLESYKQKKILLTDKDLFLLLMKKHPGIPNMELLAHLAALKTTK